jgi:hypothetical protein
MNSDPSIEIHVNQTYGVRSNYDITLSGGGGGIQREKMKNKRDYGRYKSLVRRWQTKWRWQYVIVARSMSTCVSIGAVRALGTRCVYNRNVKNKNHVVRTRWISALEIPGKRFGAYNGTPSRERLTSVDRTEISRVNTYLLLRFSFGPGRKNEIHDTRVCWNVEPKLILCTTSNRSLEK